MAMTTKKNPQPPAPSQEGKNFLQAASLLTLFIKMGGVVLAIHEAIFVDPPRDGIVFAIAAFMMAGATGLDNLIDRFFGGGK